MTGQQFYWAGTYSFKTEIPMFLRAIKKQIDEILAKLTRWTKQQNTSFKFP